MFIFFFRYFQFWIWHGFWGTDSVGDDCSFLNVRCFGCKLWCDIIFPHPVGVAGLTAAAGLPEENAPLLMPPPDNENADPDDCCNFWFCLGTSNDEQVKIIESSCSCSESDFPCSRHQRYLSSYDSFADYTPVQPSHSPRDSDSVSTNMVSGTSNDNVDSFTPHDPSKHQIQ